MPRLRWQSLGRPQPESQMADGRDCGGDDPLYAGQQVAVVGIRPAGSNNTALGLLKPQPITSPGPAGIGSMSPDSGRARWVAGTAELGHKRNCSDTRGALALDEHMRRMTSSTSEIHAVNSEFQVPKILSPPVK
jgi:hypothetical protein